MRVDHPVFVVLLIIFVVVGVVLLLRSRFPGLVSNIAASIPSISAPAAAPAAVASSPTKSKGSWGWVWPALGFVLIVALIWYVVTQVLPHFVDHVPNHGERPRGPAYSSSTKTETSAVCTKSPRPGMTFHKGTVTWIETTSECRVNLDISNEQIKEYFEKSCVDTAGNLHEVWTDEFCWHYQSLGLTLKPSYAGDSRKDDITFTQAQM